VDNTEGGISYYLEVDNNNDFSSPEYVNTNITETTNTTGDTPTGLSSDYYYWRVLAYDGSDNIQNSSWSEIRYFALTSKPHINIEYPKNTTYSDIGEIDFNWSSGSLLNIDTNWYSLNYGTNTTVTENITLTIINGSNIIKFWTNDTTGLENYTYVTFEVNTQPTVPILLYPSNNAKIGNSSVVLGCNGSTDLQGDTIYYAIYADTSNPPTTLVARRKYILEM